MSDKTIEQKVIERLEAFNADLMELLQVQPAKPWHNLKAFGGQHTVWTTTCGGAVSVATSGFWPHLAAISISSHAFTPESCRQASDFFAELAERLEGAE